MLAGDYLAFPWSDAGALTGLWGAICVRVSGGRDWGARREGDLVCRLAYRGFRA